MKGRAVLLFIWISYLLPATGLGQELPFAEILTADSAWCQQSNNLTTAEILITGEIDTSRFDLIVDVKGNQGYPGQSLIGYIYPISQQSTGIQ